VAVIDRVELGVSAGSYGVSPAAMERLLFWVRQAIADEFWAWFDLHKDDELLTVRKWIFSFTLRVRHCEPVLEALLGPRSAKVP